jgi:tetratricopeptide (TPR) repeat protein
MRSLPRIVFLAITAVLGGIVAAEDLTVVYLEGWVDVRSGGSWSEVTIGDTLESSATVRLDEDSLLELTGGGRELTLTEPGTYTLSNLLRNISARERVGYGTLLASKLKSAVRGRRDETEQSAVGGVRGDSLGEPELGWVEDDTAGLVSAGRKALEREEYDLARELFLEAYDYAYEPEAERRILFSLALTEDLRGARSSALSYLEGVEFAPGEELYDDYVLLRGKLLIDSFEYRHAVALLREYLSSPEDGSSESLQTAYFLLGIAYDGLGDPRSGRFLTKAFEIDPSSDVGRAAASLLP